MGSRYDLLTDGVSNPKTAKLAAEYGVLPTILHLASGSQASEVLGRPVSVCPFAVVNRCERACLDYSGRGGFDTRVRAARIRRTVECLTDRRAFVDRLREDLDRQIRRAARLGLRPVARLDGTSDIGLADTLAPEFPSVMFYDYTKVPARIRRWLRAPLPNRHLTFSLGAANHADAEEFIGAGVSVAVPFSIGKRDPLPTEWRGVPVIDGDAHDYRFTDPRGVWVGLRAKTGSVRRDAGGGFLIAAA